MIFCYTSIINLQDKYEDYCRSQREKQARELANKQKALSQFTLKPGFDKLDILEQAVQSAAAWNQQFNKVDSSYWNWNTNCLRVETLHSPCFAGLLGCIL